MIYVVEMDFRDPAREADWHTWYLEHVTTLIREVPGFRASQRFRALTPTLSPWLALHEVEGPRVFESAEYKSVGGPASTGEWQHRHTNWRRNLLADMDSPAVPIDGHLLMADNGTDLPSAVAGQITWLQCVGLDKSDPRRGIGVLQKGGLKAHHFGVKGLTVLAPITPKIGA
jgi:hypothetical protein